MDLNRVQIFAQVVEQGSFTGAAKALGLTKATVSRKIAELEADTGTQLLFRTTRALKLTEAGSSYYNRINKILSDLQSAENQLSAHQQLIKGNLKIVCPIELGQLFLGPIFAQFLTLYPDITIDAELTNRKVDVIEEGIDLLFQIADAHDTRLQSYSLVNAYKSLMASPSYLAEYGTPKVPQDLAKHKAIRLQSAHIEGAWKLFDGQSWVVIEPVTQLTVNNVTIAREAAIAGLGITAVPSIIAQEAVEKGYLVPLLDDYPMVQTKVVLSYPKRAYLPRKYRVFIEFIYAALFKRWGSQVLEVPDFIGQQEQTHSR
ncbi:LysR family transcriptional regulator [Shewanella sp. CG12_big_fil_rev_8_21_14_0_65_47_15]|uniref:LysR family transcriptional regulator n=1 Tax=Shewanella sp. CG12_big_fil_rev_8_21_14_0_65_47_15 TaxID=1975537 RepID=UPI000CC96F1F|nr:LysR family transcriptional regulator [Shewanella sp. CG12_big_fil_rev_8_21_14_0_65_47_15]PIW61312.1 MAG: LysR family transcriptional regulator [Shewanella sp. CG12_big_fil_rev_8_21_14_0_65_47_15]